MTKERVGYIRVSPLDQSKGSLREFSWIGYSQINSGKDTNRPQLQAALNHLRAGDI